MELDWEALTREYFSKYWLFLGIIGALYLPVIFGIKYFMKHREPFDFKYILALWNFGLAIFSLTGFLSLLPFSFRILLTQTPLKNVCDYSVYLHSEAIWVFYFNNSKVVEFVDTIFVVLRKKPLIFLHYYHHIVTFIYCWYGTQYQVLINASGWWFAVMNLAVHSFMYTYYGLTAIGYYPKWNRYLTTCQILQMAVGIIILFVSLGCEKQSTFDFVFGFVMYLSYLVLFLQLYFDKYSSKEGKEGKERKDKIKTGMNGKDGLNGFENGIHGQVNGHNLTANGKKHE